MQSITMRDYVTFLNCQTKRSFRSSAVDEFLAMHQVDLDEISPFCLFREDACARNLVHRNDHYELFVLAWLPGQTAPIHDHAGQRCWITVATGQLTLQDYEPNTNDLCPPVAKGRPEAFSVGDSVYMDDGIGLHSITNAGKAPAVTLHLCAGPMTHCRVFDPGLGKFRQVELRCFPPPPMEWNPEHPSDL